MSSNEPGDEGLSTTGSGFNPFNTGVYLLRYSAVTAEWAHTWRAAYDTVRPALKLKPASSAARRGSLRPGGAPAAHTCGAC